MNIGQLVEAMTAVVKIRKASLFLRSYDGLTSEMRREVGKVYEHAERLEGLLLDAAGPKDAGPPGGEP